MNRSTQTDGSVTRGPDYLKMRRPFVVTEGEVRELMLAMEAYKQRSGRLFPTWSEILEVIRSLGYAKRIWKPVVVWSPLSEPSPSENGVGDGSLAMLGWFARAETMLGP